MANKAGGKTCLRHTQFNNVNSVYLFIKEKTKATYLLVMIKIEIELIKRSDSFQKKKKFQKLDRALQNYCVYLETKFI